MKWKENQIIGNNLFLIKCSCLHFFLSFVYEMVFSMNFVGDPAVTTSQSLNAVFMNYGYHPFDLVKESMKLVSYWNIYYKWQQIYSYKFVCYFSDLYFLCLYFKQYAGFWQSVVVTFHWGKPNRLVSWPSKSYKKTRIQ